MWLLAAVVAGLTASGAAAQSTGGLDKNAYELFAQCESVSALVLQGVCLGYLAGVIDGSADGDTAEEAGFCLPDGYPLGQAREDYIDWLPDNRGARGALAADAVRAMLAERYPCPAAP